MITLLIAVLDAAIVVLVIFTILAARASAWYGQQARLWLTDYDEANPPRSVRLYKRITNRKDR